MVFSLINYLIQQSYTRNNAVGKSRLLFIQSSESEGTKCLHHSYHAESGIIPPEFLSIHLCFRTEIANIMIEQVFSVWFFHRYFCVIKHRCNVILRCAFSSSLVINEPWLLSNNHSICSLKIAVKKIILPGFKKIVSQGIEIMFQPAFIKWCRQKL